MMETYTMPDGSHVRFSVGAPEIEGDCLDEPVFDGPVARWAGLELRKAIRPIPDGFGITLEFTNRRHRPVRLNRLIPFKADSARDAFPCSSALADWRVFVMARQKNNVPGYFRPASPDPAMNDIAFDTSEAVAGGGIHQADDGSPLLPHCFTSDPGMVFETGPAAHPLLLAFLGQHLHMNTVILETNSARSALVRLEAAALFDGVCVVPGSSVHTHELLLRSGASTRGLLSEFTEGIAGLYGVPAPSGSPPTIYCTWYFYGEDFTEEDLHENLAELARRPIPCDIVQVDNGWMDRYGDWRVNDRFPAGLESMARAIRDAGYTPGIWTAPFVLEPHSNALNRWPDLALQNAQGEPCIFRCSRGDCRVLDPFAPHAEPYLSDLFQRLHDAGFRYHKLDFVRALILHADARYHDPSKNRAQAYRHALHLVRQAAGPDSLIEVCGGLFEGTAGLADAVRSGRDVKGCWSKDDSRASNYDMRIRQNVCRNHYNRLWYTDPDALQLRRRTEPFRGNIKTLHLAMGEFTDEEAFTLVVNTFLGGGLACFSERLVELDEDRRLLLRHVIPQRAPAAEWITWPHSAYGPDILVTRIDDPPNGLDPWVLVTCINWADEARPMKVDLRDVHFPAVPGVPRAVFEFREQRHVGMLQSDAAFTATIPPHGSRVFRITPCPDHRTALIGTDLNLSQGLEITEWKADSNRVILQRRSDWKVPLTVTLRLPDGRIRTVTLPAGETKIRRNTSSL